MKIKVAHVTFYTLSPVYTVCTTIHEFSAETNWQKNKQRDSSTFTASR